MIKRRHLLVAGCAPSLTWTTAQAAVDAGWTAPPRFSKPDLSTDEGGLWAIMDREESRLRRGPFAIRDKSLRAYLQTVATRLVPGHIEDVRIYPVRTAMFNASMAPNGMMQVWSGLLLRMDNEAQLAAVLGHELAHYLQRHSLESLRNAKDRSALNMFFGMFGVVGLVGSLINVASMYGYSRDHERDADMIGLQLLRQAGYDTREAAKVWDNLQLELAQAHGGDPSQRSVMFASHPASQERSQTLRALSAADQGGRTGELEYRQQTLPLRPMLIEDELARGQYAETIALMSRLMTTEPREGWFIHARAEAFRLRAQGDDHDHALADYQRAISEGIAPAACHRGIGLIHRQRAQASAASEAFARYVELAPDAGDAAMITSYIEKSQP